VSRHIETEAVALPVKGGPVKQTLKEGQIMKKSILPILVIFVLWTPGIIYAQDATGGEVMRITPTNVISEEPALDNGSLTYFNPPKTKGDSLPVSSPREWHIIAKNPNSKHLMIGVFLLQEGMPIEHIHSILGKPQDNVTPDIEGYGPILVYLRHYLFFSATGHLQTIKER